MYFLCLYRNKNNYLKWKIHYHLSKNDIKKEYYQLAQTPLLIFRYHPFHKNIQKQLENFFQRILDYQALGKNFNESLFLMKEHHHSPLPVYVLETILNDLLLGDSLIKAFQKHPLFFSNDVVDAFQTSFKTGNVYLYLELFIYQSKKISLLKKNLIKKLYYPVTLIILIIFLFFFYHFQILPKYQELFNTLQINPHFKQNLVLSPWYFFIIPLCCMFYFFKWHIPFIHHIQEDYKWWLWSHRMYQLLTVGYPFIYALQISLQKKPCKILLNFYHQLLCGESLQNTNLSSFPWMIKETFLSIALNGEHPLIFKRLCEFLDKKIVESTQKIELYLQPILISILGAICAKIIYLVYQPLLELNIY